MEDMARPRNTIANIVEFNLKTLKETISKMSDDKLGAWFRKAIFDCAHGCSEPNVDPFIKESYERSLAKMLARQNIDAQKYQQRKALGSGKPDCTISTNDQETPSAGGSCVTFSLDASTRKGEDELTTNGAGRPVDNAVVLLESATSRQPITTTPHHTISTTPQLTLEGEIQREGVSKSAAVSLSAATPSSISAKMPFGTCGNVMLTEAEGRHLREVYGSDLKIAIDILDAYIENGGKAAKKYKNHSAVMRKGNWVWNKVMEMKRQEKLLENASRGPKNWKAEERERTARVLRGESADGKNYVRDEDLTPKEFMEKYGNA